MPAGLDADVAPAGLDADVVADDDGVVLAEDEAAGVDEGPPAAGCRRRDGNDLGCAEGTADGLAVT